MTTQNWKAHPAEKVVRIGLIGLLIYGGMKLFNALSPTVITFLSNIWVIIGLGVPLVFLAMFVLQNPMFIWMGYKTICRKIVSAFIKIDPLSFMERYIDILYVKLGNLRKINEQLLAKKKIGVDKIKELEAKSKKNFELAKAAQQKGLHEDAGLYASYIQDYKESLDALRPGVQRLDYYNMFFDKLGKNWEVSIKKLENKVETKKEEYQTGRMMAKAAGQAEAFVRGNTEEGRIFQESLRVLEEKIAADVAKIEQFEKDAKEIMKTITLDGQVQQNKGLELLEKYSNSNELFLPESYEDIEFTMVSGKVPEKIPMNTSFNKLLK